MKRINKFFAIALVAFSSLVASNCTDEFDKLNSNPRTIPLVEPEQLLYRTLTEWFQSGHAWESNYISKIQWMQYGTPAAYFTSEADMQTRWTYGRPGIGNTLYSEYNNMGSYVTTMEYLAGKSATPEKYTDLVQMGRILLIAKAINTSDMWGSLAYSGAWLSRKGMVDEASMTPVFQTQEELVVIWDKELKECIQKLQAGLNATGKVAIGGYDRAYKGDPQKWIKAANGIRLRLASRIWKKQPQTAIAIATEVLAPANAANIFSSKDDSFIFWFDNLYTNVHSGDWHSVEDLNRASAVFIGYLNKYDDPRRPIYYKINNLTPENVAEFNRQRKVNGDNPFWLLPNKYGRFEGAVISFDSRSAMPAAPADMPKRSDYPAGAAGDDAFKVDRDAYYDNWDFDARWATITTYDRRYTAAANFALPGTTANIDMRPANIPQTRLWRGNWDSGTGGNWAPVMTFADFSFLAAEFVLRANVPSSKTAQQWYETGLRASLDQWNDLGKFCAVYNYQAMTETAISDFLNKPDIKWDPAKALEQIYTQAYVDHYKNVDEQWAQWKRTGYPNTGSGIVTFEKIMVSGIERTVPRRVKFSYPAEGVHNYNNLKKRIDDMAKDPNFGAIDNEWGRVWWDIP